MNITNEEASRQRTATEAEARVKSMIRDLAIPLDANTMLNTQYRPDSRSPLRRRTNDRNHQRHEQELQRARNAAERAFGVRRSRFKRKAATAMLAASAVGLAAFTTPGPTRPKMRSGVVENQLPGASGLAEGRQHARHLTVSDEFKRALIEEEGVRHTVYRDVAGYPTVGVGHLVVPGDNLRVGDRISSAQVMRFLESDLQMAEEGVRQLVGDLSLHQHEFDALVDLVYNVGVGNVSKDKSPRLNAAIDAGDYDGIAEELSYHYAGGSKANGLVNRSERRSSIFLEASYDDPRETRSARAG